MGQLKCYYIIKKRKLLNKVKVGTIFWLSQSFFLSLQTKTIRQFKMDNSKIVELLKVLKKIYVCEMAGFNESFDLVQYAKIDDLNTFLEENGVDTLDVLESCYDVKYMLENRFLEKGCEKTPKGVKDFFDRFEGIELSDNEANGIYEKYLKTK